MARNDSILHPPKIRWLIEPTYDEDGVQRSAGIDSDGREHGDPVPVRPPIGLNVSHGDELHATLRKLFVKEREAWKAMIEREQFESEEEANDFLVEEELFPPGNEPWEDVFEFPAGDEGRSPTLASEAPNGNAGHQNPASQPSTSGEGTVSASSVSEEVRSPSVQTPKSGGVDTSGSAGTGAVPVRGGQVRSR